MCSSRGRCGGGNRPANRSSRSGSSGSGSHYALCALGVGLIALGIVMIVWTVIPIDGESSGSAPAGNSSTPVPESEEGGPAETTKTSSVAFVLVGVGAVMLLLAICLGMRNKQRQPVSEAQSATAGALFMDHTAQEQEAAEDRATYSVPSYEEVVGSGQYPVRQSNLRQSTSQLPSYEDIIAAVENEGNQPANNPVEEAALAVHQDDQPSSSQPANTEPQAEPEPAATHSNPPSRSTSRASRILRPLRVRRIKSDKLHLKDFRLHIRSPTHNPVTIEPITPPPQYDDKVPKLAQ